MKKIFGVVVLGLLLSGCDENPFKKYFRLSPGKEVRLKDAYYITCNDLIKDKEFDPLSYVITLAKKRGIKWQKIT